MRTWKRRGPAAASTRAPPHATTDSPRAPATRHSAAHVQPAPAAARRTRRMPPSVTCTSWPWHTLPVKNVCRSAAKPLISVSSTSSPFSVSTRVCPTNDSTSVSWCAAPGRSVSAHMPLMPGRSMDACSWMPMPLRMMRSEPILNAPATVRPREREPRRAAPPAPAPALPEQVMSWFCPWRSRSTTHMSTMGARLVKVSMGAT